MKKLGRLPEVKAAVGLSRSEIERREKAGKFPRRIALSPRCTVWDMDEVNQWILDRIAERGKADEERQRAEAGQRLKRARMPAAVAA